MAVERAENQGDHGESMRVLADDAVHAGLLEATQEEIEALLAESLYADVLAASERAVPIAEWASGDYGPKSLIERFLKYQGDAIRAQICRPDGRGLKAEYAKLTKADASKAGGLAGISGALMATLDSGAGKVIGPATAVYLALWLMHANLEAWCSAGRRA